MWGDELGIGIFLKPTTMLLIMIFMGIATM
jgi:hypothetical protein